jgi:UDP-N-acetylmuramoyl-L-alanyl-D-glutamate--2,6-diaminopimelate ligase
LPKLKLSELFEIAGLEAEVPGNDPIASGVAEDSRRVEPGQVFVATRGVSSDSHLFISDAVEAGAVAVVTEQPIASYPGVAMVQVPDSRDALGRLAHAMAGNPSRDMLVIGVTGTNGKTTTTYLLESILTAAGMNVGVLGTIEYRFAGQRIEAANTTPSATQLARMFAQMKEAGVNAVAMEVSSHAADQRRISGIDFDGCIFTNITQDHLDYHGTMENYAAAKLRIFTDYLQRGAKNKPKPPVSIINIDDDRIRQMRDQIPGRVLSIGIDQPADYQARDISFTADSTTFGMAMGNSVVELQTHLVGHYNVLNVLGAVAVAHATGISLESIRDGLSAIEVVPGRLETIREGQDFLVLVDYAHTPDALERVLTNARHMTQNRLIVVFGCGGDRDPGKRPLMGKAAGDLADVVVVTSDNPRTEDPIRIIEDVMAGVEESAAAGKAIQVLPDRRAAIAYAIETAASGDVVVIAGKGHEDYQILGTEKIHFDDREQARNFLRNKTNNA